MEEKKFQVVATFIDNSGCIVASGLDIEKAEEVARQVPGRNGFYDKTKFRFYPASSIKWIDIHEEKDS